MPFETQHMVLGEEAEPDWVQFQSFVFHRVLLRVDVECFLDSRAPLQTMTFAIDHFHTVEIKGMLFEDRMLSSSKHVKSSVFDVGRVLLDAYTGHASRGSTATDNTARTINFIGDGVTQPLQRILRPLNVRVVGKPSNWKWSLQQQLKHRTSREDDPGVVYRFKCGDCEQAYIGETGRTACVRFKEHALDFDSVEVIDCERHGLKRRVKEALYMNAEKHSRNKDKGLELNPIWLSLFPNTLCSVSKGITYFS